LTGSRAYPLAPASLLDRLLDPPPRTGHATASAGEVIRAAEAALRRDIESLLNARKPWRSVPAEFAALAISSLTYGLADFTGGAVADRDGQERLRREIETAITRFEPRLTGVEVEIVETPSALKSQITFRVTGLLLLEPVSEPISFDTVADTVTSDITLQARGALTR
jgi:type VI secretion system protein ImpF